MKKRQTAVVSCIFLSASLLTISFGASGQKGDKATVSRDVSIVLLDTTDLHGRIEPWDYYADKPANLGLAKIATLIKQQRAQAPDALLFDAATRFRERRSRTTSLRRTRRNPTQ